MHKIAYSKSCNTSHYISSKNSDYFKVLSYGQGRVENSCTSFAETAAAPLNTFATVLNSSESERNPFYGFRLLLCKSVGSVRFYRFICYVFHNAITIQIKLDN